MENTNLPPVMETPAGQPPTGNKKWLVPVIVIVAIIVVAGGYQSLQRWRAERAVNSLLNELGVDKNAAGLFGANINDLAGDIAREAAKAEAEAKKSPAEKFADAEIIDISDNAHLTPVNLIGDAIKTIFDGAKITGYTSGYMGMNSGSGVAQYTVPKLLSTNEADALSKELENKGLKILTTVAQNDSASIMAQKDNFTYTISYNNNEQEITAVILKGEAAPSAE